MYNVEVEGRLVWLEWTRDYSRAMREYLGWLCLGKIIGRPLRVRILRR